MLNVDGQKKKTYVAQARNINSWWYDRAACDSAVKAALRFYNLKKSRVLHNKD